MFILTLFSSYVLTAAYNDWDYQTLRLVDRNTEGNCSVDYGSGSITTSYAYDARGGTMSPVAIISANRYGTTSPAAQSYVKTSFGPAWRALVYNSPGRTTIVVNRNFLGDLMMDDSATFQIVRGLNIQNANDGVLLGFDNSEDSLRRKIADVLDCDDDMID